MLSYIIAVGIGAFIGWNLPQPEWAKRLQDAVTGWFGK